LVIDLRRWGQGTGVDPALVRSPPPDGAEEECADSASSSVEPSDVAEKLPPSALAVDRRARAFELLVAQHLEFVWRLLRRFGLSPADADDVAQQVFMLAARKLDEQLPGKERTFLYGVARRLAANARRHRRRRREVCEDLGELAAAAGAAPDELVECQRAARLLDALLERLPPELGRVLVLAELEQQTVPAIAELEGIPVGTAASRLRRARAMFGELLERASACNPFGRDEP
jgi:RNA polymerase sigma-70 factor (ECF subfamily)